MTQAIVIHCPYCGEAFETVADPSAGSQHYVEDCAICCKPIEVRVRVSEDGELVDVYTATDSE